jgi:hypothetical protein
MSTHTGSGGYDAEHMNNLVDVLRRMLVAVAPSEDLQPHVICNVGSLPKSDFIVYLDPCEAGFYTTGPGALVDQYKEWPNYFRDKGMVLEAINILKLEDDMWNM